MRKLARTFSVVALGALLAALAATPAQAQFGLKDFSFAFLNEDGSAAVEAGSHPYEVRTAFGINTKAPPGGGPEVSDGSVKNLRFDLPPGFVGSRTAVARCSTANFLEISPEGYSNCPDATALGVARARILQPDAAGTPAPVYNLTPPPGVAAKIGFVVAAVPITAEVGINDEIPNNIVSKLANVPQAIAFYGSVLQLWGVPADHSHDAIRGSCLSKTLGPAGELQSRGICDTGAIEAPFLTMPSSCTGPLITTYEATSWQSPGAVPDRGESVAPGMTGCSRLGFAPDITAKPTTSSAESASGLDISVNFHDEGLTNPTGYAQSAIKDSVVKLPRGMTVNPSSASGLAVCPAAGYAAETVSSRPGEGCPQASKIGEVELESPLAEGEVFRGAVFLASQDDNPFGSLIALYMVIKDPGLGLLIKRPIKVEPSEEGGPEAGRLIATLENTPQLPFSRFNFHFKEGARAPLVTPPGCGTYATEAQFTPWAEPAKRLTTTATFTVNSGVGGGSCPPGGAQPFHPNFEAGSINNNAGSYSPFNMRITRQDGEQDLTRFSAVLPSGVVGKIAGVSKCSDAAIAAARSRTGRAELAAPSCPANSQLGSVLTGAGVGGTLTYVPGSLYLAGPFGGDPLSVVAIVPAVAGPFDVGTVVTRVALTVNPDTYLAEVDGSNSEPIPHMLKGIPLKLRDLRVYTDRPDFTLNATSCDVEKAHATMFGSFLDVFSPADDVPVSAAARYQAASCASLKFKPDVSLTLKGGTKRADHPALKSVITYPRGKGYANLGRAVVLLPPSEFIDNAHISSPCTRVQFSADNCPKASILGTVSATTPLLDEPLKGRVYFRSNGGERLLPDIVIDVRGLVRATIVGYVDSTQARIRTTFAKLPDVPITKVNLNLYGGKKGLLVNNRNLCGHKLRSKINLTAHSGRTYNTEPVLKTSCGKGGKGKGKSKGK